MENNFYEVKIEEYNESPPILSVSTNVLNLEIAISGVYTGAFKIKNKGKGKLKGRIVSKNGYATFNPDEWNSNEQVIIYRIDAKEMLCDTDYTDTWLIESNGGEKEILVDIHITYPLLIIDDKNSLSNLKEFAHYAKSNWSNAKEIFFSPIFLSWLSHNKNMEFVKIYRQMSATTYKDWALEYFLRLVGVKQSPTLWVQENERKVEISSGEIKPIIKVIVIHKRGWGLLDAEVKTDVNWIRIKKNTFALHEFDNNKFVLEYEILPGKTNGKVNYGNIYIHYEEQQIVYHVTIVKEKIISFSFSKKSYNQKDIGILVVENNSGEDILLDINPKDSWIIFEAKKYLIAQYAEIPFRVHLTKWDQWGMGKSPYYDSIIEIQANTKRRKYRQKVYKKIDVVC